MSEYKYKLNEIEATVGGLRLGSYAKPTLEAQIAIAERLEALVEAVERIADHLEKAADKGWSKF